MIFRYFNICNFEIPEYRSHLIIPNFVSHPRETLFKSHQLSLTKFE